MGSHHSRSVLLGAMLVLCGTFPICVSANYINFPSTPLEKMATLSSVTKHRVPITIFGPNVESFLAGLPSRIDYEFDYSRASSGQRRIISQIQGERGAARFSTGQRWKTLLGPHGHKLNVGPDSVYWDRQSGRVRVIEAKGGAGRTSVSYGGTRQGTNKNTIRSAARVLTSPRASLNENLQAARIVKAAQRGQLTTGVVATRILSGRFSDPQRVGRWSTRNVSSEAARIEQRLFKQYPESRRFFRKAGFLHNVDRMKYRGARLLALGSVSARALVPESAHRARLQGVGRVIGRWFVPVGVGIASATVMVTHYQASSGLISTREFYRRSAEPAIMVVLTTAGAILGGSLGASLGAFAAVPAGAAADWAIDRYHRDFDLGQRRLVDAAVEEVYGVDPILRRDL